MTTTTTTSNAKTKLDPLSDPFLSPFLVEGFSPASYLNASLPKLAINATSASNTTPTSPPPDDGPVPLANAHAKANTLLSNLDTNLNRYENTLTSITDDILRITPRLGYEIEVLRSDIISVAETLASPATQAVLQALVDEVENNEHVENGVKDENKNISEIPEVQRKPDVLKKLETLVKVRTQLEEVIRIFGEAMKWTLTKEDATAASTASTTATSGPDNRSITPVPVTSSRPEKQSGSAQIEQDVTFMITNQELEKATARVENLAKLCTVWKNTSEHAARIKFVEGLRWKIMEAGRGEMEVVDEQGLENGRDAPGESKGAEGILGGYGIVIPGVNDAGKDGYYGLINQFQRMRGMGQ